MEIDAPPDAVWPWLVQMGYNRAGWYSYDLVDMKGASVDTIVPELQHLAVGDLVPNSPDTSFVVRALEPGRALVLFADEKTVEEQVAAARARKEAGEAVEDAPANLKAAGEDDAGDGRLRRELGVRPASRSTRGGGRASWSASGSGCRRQRVRPRRPSPAPSASASSP